MAFYKKFTRIKVERVFVGVWGRDPSLKEGVVFKGVVSALRDLLKWCQRISSKFDNSSSSTAQRVFQEVS